MKLILLGKPASTNHIYKHVCRGRFSTVYMSKEGKDLKESYIQQAKHQFKGSIRQNAVGITINLYFDTHRKHDIDNYSKILLDSLTGIVWEDDGQIERMSIEKHYDKENPRIEINIEDYDKN